MKSKKNTNSTESLITECRVKRYVTGHIYDDCIDFYRNKLHFELLYYWDESSNDRGSMFLLNENTILEFIDKGINIAPFQELLSLKVENIDYMYAFCTSSGLDVKKPILRSWGDIELKVKDPSDCILTFFSPSLIGKEE